MCVTSWVCLAGDNSGIKLNKRVTVCAYCLGGSSLQNETALACCVSVFVYAVCISVCACVCVCANSESVVKMVQLSCCSANDSIPETSLYLEYS